MARTNKTGIDYFPFDIDFFQDDKIQFVSARFGIKGEVIAIRLLCKIYRNGYYAEWNDDTALLFAKGVGDGCQDSCVKDVVYELLKRGFFDRSIFERFGILTSKGIQSRYFEAVKRYKSVEVVEEFLLVNVEKMNNVSINKINVNINSENADINTQKKEKRKEKEKERKYNSEFSFDEVWELYERKGNKKTSERKWANLKNHCREAALKHIPLYVQSTPERQYRKNFETYINQECWNDEIINRSKTKEIIDKDGNRITIEDKRGMGTHNSANWQNAFRTDAEKRRNEREMLGQVAEAVLRQP